MAVILGVVGVLAGLALQRYLASRHYRYDDERDLPTRRTWWVVPVVAAATVALGALLPDGDARVAIATTYALAFVWMAGLAAIDIDVRRLPDAWTLPSYPVATVLLGWCALAADEGDRWWVAVVCGLASGLVYLVLAFVNPAGLGMGDVKLAVTLGMLTGWWDPVYAVLAFIAAFLAGLVVGVIVAVRSGEGRKATFPFGPPMLLGAVAAVLLAVPALS